MKVYFGIMIGIMDGNGEGVQIIVKLVIIKMNAFYAHLANSYSLTKMELSVFDGNNLKTK